MDLLQIMYLGFLEDQISSKGPQNLFETTQERKPSQEWTQLLDKHFDIAIRSTGYHTLLDSSYKFKNYFNLPNDYIQQKDISTITKLLNEKKLYYLLKNCIFPLNYVFFKKAIWKSCNGSRFVYF